MALRVCGLTGKKLNFPEECKGCDFLKPRGKRLCSVAPLRRDRVSFKVEKWS